MKDRTKHSDLNNLIDNIVNSMLVIGVIIGSLAFLISLAAAFKHGVYDTHLTDFLVICGLTTVAFFRKKISKPIKSLIVIIGLFTLILTSMVNSGIYSNNVVLIALVPIFVYLVNNLKNAVWAFLILLFLMAGIAYLFITGTITNETDYTARNSMIYPWILRTVIITVVAFLIVIIVQKFHQSFIKLIEDLKQKNIEIAQNEESYRTIFNASADAIFVHDLKGNIIEVNDAMLNTFGYSPEELEKLTLADLSSGKGEYTAENAIKHVEEALVRDKKVFDWKAKKKNGDLFWVEVSLKKTKILGNERVLAVVSDIDEKKKNALQLHTYKNHLEELVQERTFEMEEAFKELMVTNRKLDAKKEELENILSKLKSAQDQLLQSEKMASLGVLAAGVAHEINNPLNFIQGGLNGLEEFFENSDNKPEEVDALLNAIDEGIDRAAAIVSSLNHFNRHAETRMELCNVHDIINNCLVILNNQLKNRIIITKTYSDIEPIINGNDGKLHQAILNILTNAEQAIEQKGEINITTEVNNEKVIIAVSDNGSGIKPENLSKITEPFFTTKEAGKGTGLGLSITYNIVQEHRGELSYTSEYGTGTTATISLPIV